MSDSVIQPGRIHPKSLSIPAHVKHNKPNVIFGDLTVNGDLDIENHLVVVGDLVCAGLIHSEQYTCISVGGDVRAKAFLANESWWLVGGALTADIMWLEGGGFLCEKTHARLLVMNGDLELENDNSITGTWIRTDYFDEDDDAKAAMRAALIPGAYESLWRSSDEDEGWFDVWKLVKRIARGKTILVQ
ncbi:MAG: hypothetical protein LBE83_09810 [Propionibacteriaceae bacterium]|jgi:hypothetical protein|nr:hypothetical protein [Propionibacteriaceae bacterium]